MGRAEALRRTCRPPLKTRWVDVNKGDERTPDIRCRLVAEEIAFRANDDVFAATPPLEALRLLLSDIASRHGRGTRPEIKMMAIDASKAHLHAMAGRELYIELPPEAGGGCARLRRSLYEIRDALALWEAFVAAGLHNLGFVRGRSNACACAHPRRGLRCIAHGDDFAFTGVGHELAWVRSELEKVMLLKVVGVLGSGKDDQKELRVLNRIIRHRPEGIAYEADPRHAEILQAVLFPPAHAVSTLGVKPVACENAPPESSGTEEQTEDLKVFSLDRPVSGQDLVWHRRDWGASAFRITMRGGPEYSPVTRRVATDLNTGEIIENLPVDATQQSLHSPLPFRPRDIRTTLYYRSRPGAPRERSARILAEDEDKEECEDTDEPLHHLLALRSRLGRRERGAQQAAGEEEEEEPEVGEHQSEPLPQYEAGLYRAAAARANNLALDRPGLSFSAKELCRRMGEPRRGDLRALRRLWQYLLVEPRWVYHFAWQGFGAPLRVCVDTDFVGCQLTRRSTSGGRAMHGAHLVKHWSTTQKAVTLGSVEVELGGIVKGVGEGIGLCSLGRDLLLDMKLEVQADSAAAIGICRRSGIYRARRLAVGQLRVEEKLCEGCFSLRKVVGTANLANPADLLTKYLAGNTLRQHLEALEVWQEARRAELAPKVSAEVEAWLASPHKRRVGGAVRT